MKILSSEITPEKIYKNRRKFIKQLGLTSSAFCLAPGLLSSAQASNKLTDYNYVTTYNNYYEFGTGKSDPAQHSKDFISDPWSITIDGEVEKKLLYLWMILKNYFPQRKEFTDLDVLRDGQWLYLGWVFR